VRLGARRNGDTPRCQIDDRPRICRAQDLDAIDRRTRAYHAAGVPVVWLATLDLARAAWHRLGPRLIAIERYAAPAWQHYAAALHGALWFWIDGQLWRGRLDHAWVARPTQDLAEGDWSVSRRWSTLTLEGPFAPEATRLTVGRRDHEVHETFALPAGRTARLVAIDETAAPNTVEPRWTDWEMRTPPKMAANATGVVPDLARHARALRCAASISQRERPTSDGRRPDLRGSAMIRRSVTQAVDAAARRSSSGVPRPRGEPGARAVPCHGGRCVLGRTPDR